MLEKCLNLHLEKAILYTLNWKKVLKFYFFPKIFLAHEFKTVQKTISLIFFTFWLMSIIFFCSFSTNCVIINVWKCIHYGTTMRMIDKNSETPRLSWPIYVMIFISVSWIEYVPYICRNCTEVTHGFKILNCQSASLTHIFISAFLSLLKWPVEVILTFAEVLPKKLSVTFLKSLRKLPTYGRSFKIETRYP